MEITKRETLIILDWDDTLFPSSWVIKNNLDIADPSTRIVFNDEFKELDDIVYNLLYTMKKLGKVIIITNAMPEWVSLSSSLLRKTNSIMKDISIISSRKDYNKKKGTTIKDWKRMSFAKELHKFLNQNKTINNIISIGDADYEFNALTSLYHWNKIIPKYKYLKTIKFMTAPSYHSLIDQLNVLSLCITKIRNRKTHMDLRSQNLK